MKKKHMEKGITLIALVVTIVVLIILATISIKGIVDQNGIIKEAQKGRDMTANATMQEDKDMQDMLDMATTESAIAGAEVTKPSGWTSDKVIAISDGKGGRVPLPSGFFYVGGNKDSGLVISDAPADANKGTSHAIAATLVGNQFVWIPVASEADFTRTYFDSYGKPVNGFDTVIYTEPCTGGYATEASEYNTMKNQVLKYGGFYIGRYEAGDGTNGATFRTGPTEAHTVVSKRGVVPYNNVPWGTSMSAIGTSANPCGAVYLAKNMYASSQSVTSTLIYGSQWDAMCRYIEDNRRMGPSGYSSYHLTGDEIKDLSKNIYDLAGNCIEWTMEAVNGGMRMGRGGAIPGGIGISERVTSFTPNQTGICFRVALHIK